MRPTQHPNLADVMAARQVIAGVADHTPMVPSHFMSARAGHEFLLKLEICQPMGAFKLRGALNAMVALPAGTRGVTCCSTGNHGRAVAFAAARAGLRAVVCMSDLVPRAKVEGIRALGGEVRISGRSQDDAARESARLARDEGLVEIPPFDDAHVIAGQGTIGLEMMEARPDLTTLLVPLSGGGLMSGVALAARAIRPGIRIIGVTMERGAAMAQALAAGHLVEVGEYPSLADSLGGGLGDDNRLTFAMCRDLVDEVVLVSEDEIRDAMQALFFEDRIVAEGGSVVGLAAVLAGRVRVNGPAATIITGRNLDMAKFAAMMAARDVTIGDLTIRGRVHGA